MNRLLIISAAIVLFFSACKNHKADSPSASIGIKIVEAKGYVVPQDSISTPKVVPVDENKLKKIVAGKPKMVVANTNIHPAGKPNVVAAGSPRICTPGIDGFTLPKTIPAKVEVVLAGIPEVVVAKDAHTRDQNPHSFSSFSQLQGLKSGFISCMLTDHSGNLWFGTQGGGVSKYDGKSFTHFTEKEGLSNNIVWSVLEDHSGNLWFGTQGGVCKIRW